MSDFKTVFNYQQDHSRGSTPPRASSFRVRGSGVLKVPTTFEASQFEHLVKTFETTTGFRVADAIPVVQHPAETGSGVRVAYESKGHSNNERGIQDTPKIVEQVQGPLPFNASNWAVCIIKPDAIDQGLTNEVWERIEGNGLKVMAARQGLNLPVAHLNHIWPSVDDLGNKLPANPWWNATVDYMTSGPVDTLLVRGDNASTAMKAIKQVMRVNRYGLGYQDDPNLPVRQRVQSVIHTSDCDKELRLNSGGFWNPDELRQIASAPKPFRAA